MNTSTNQQKGTSMFTHCKFSEMPGFLEYKEVLAQNGIEMEDRIVTFYPTDQTNIDEKMSLLVIGSKYYVRSFYQDNHNEKLHGPKDPRFVNAKVVQCDALFGYDEQAIIRSSWQWVLVNGRYFNDFNNSADCYWCCMGASPANNFRKVVEVFNDASNSPIWMTDHVINVTDNTDSVKWVLWMPEDIQKCIDEMMERNQ